MLDENDYEGWKQIERRVPFQGYRTYVAFTYIGFNIVGFIVNFWVLYVVAPLLLAPAVKVPKSILFFIFALCVGDLMTMIAMFFLIIELIFGSWQFSTVVCTSYLVFDSMNKFVAPIIVFLISRTCYTTVCLEKSKGERAASLKYAILQVAFSLCCVMLLLWPVFAYSQVFTFHLKPNNITQEVTVMRKCGFFPPPQIEFWFNLVACFTSYAVPLFGIIYWYVSVPFFLKRRALTTLVASSSIDAALRKVITTVLLLTVIYVLCWSPYWVSMFAHLIYALEKKSMIIMLYFIHLLPYVSCVAYPLIFTLLNRGIRTAHAKIVHDHRRRFRSLTDEAGSQFRNVFRNIPSMANVTVRCRISSFVSSHQNEKDKREEEKADQEIPLKPHHLTPTTGVSVPVSVLDVRDSLSSMDLNESETLL